MSTVCQSTKNSSKLLIYHQTSAIHRELQSSSTFNDMQRVPKAHLFQRQNRTFTRCFESVIHKLQDTDLWALCHMCSHTHSDSVISLSAPPQPSRLQEMQSEFLNLIKKKLLLLGQTSIVLALWHQWLWASNHIIRERGRKRERACRAIINPLLKTSYGECGL